MNFIDDICQQVVSPPKLRYSPYDLGHTLTPYGQRHDFTVTNLNGLKINASFFENKKSNNPHICVIYLHSMNGSKLESLVYVEEVRKMGLTFCNFDFSGCGNSQGNRISFGANQKYDVSAVVERLKEKYGIQKVILWGRSMGAACAVKYSQMIQRSRLADERQHILGLVMDSCFNSFSRLAVEIGSNRAQIPTFLVKAGFMMIKGKLQQKGNFKIQELQLNQFIPHINRPALFLTSKDDTTVSSEHSKELYDLYGHPLKKLVYINGLHNESRDQGYIQQIRQFIITVIQYDQNKQRSSMHSGMRVSRFEKMIQTRNYVFQGYETEDQSRNQCYCSLLPPSVQPKSPKQSMERSKTEVFDKIRIKKINGQSSPYNSRSTKYFVKTSF